jgi:hypothetical protein
MKKMNKKISTIAIAFALTLCLSACFDEYDEGYDIVGAVATIPTLTLSKSNPVAGEQLTLTFRYYSENIKVNELRLTETIGVGGTAAVVQTKTITDFDVKNSYQDSFAYTVPSVAIGTRIVLTVEVKTANELLNTRAGTITVN